MMVRVLTFVTTTDEKKKNEEDENHNSINASAQPTYRQLLRQPQPELSGTCSSCCGEHESYAPLKINICIKM